VQHWLRSNLAFIPDDTSKGFDCPVSGRGPDEPDTLTLSIRVIPSVGCQRGP